MALLILTNSPIYLEICKKFIFKIKKYLYNNIIGGNHSLKVFANLGLTKG